MRGRAAIGVKAIVAGEPRKNFEATRLFCVLGQFILQRDFDSLRDWLSRSNSRSLGGAVVVDCPGVGSNLKDHPMLSVTFPLKEQYQMPSSDSLLSSFYLQFDSEIADYKPNDLVIFSMNLMGWNDEARQNGRVSTGFVPHLLLREK